jgi:hypothetical protein
MRLLRIPEPFDHPDFLYEVKFDGFRALAHVTGHLTTGLAQWSLVQELTVPRRRDLRNGGA